MRELFVFMDGSLCGSLSQSKSGDLTFSYDERYRGRLDSTPLSLSMPLLVEEHRKVKVLPFFDGLLTDNEQAREAMGRRFGVSWRNPFALLEHMGADVAGALQILPPGVPPTDSDGSASVQPMNDAEVELELEAAIEEYRDGRTPTERAGRFSLAGAQPKTALVRLTDGSWAAPLGSTPSTHILKPVTGSFRRMDVLEHLTMRAAAILGLDVAETEICRFGEQRAFVTKRYDRQPAGNTWRRLHQEDLCQALGVPPAKKYQRGDGGPGVAEAARLFAGLRTAGERDAVTRSFYTWLVFNTVFEGTDAHAKNFSLLLRGPLVGPAPLYDLATYTPYKKPGETTYSSMKIGGEYRFSAIGAAEFVKTAKTLRVDSSWAAGEYQRLRTDAADAFAMAGEQLVSDDEDTKRFVTEAVDAVSEHAESRRM